MTDEMRTFRFTAFPDSKNQSNNLQQILDEASILPEYSIAHIKLLRGVYSGQFFFDGNKIHAGTSGVSVLVEGCGLGKTVISGSLAASEILSDGLKRGTFRTYTAFFSGPRVELRKLTIENTSGLPPPEGIGEKAMQGIALYAAAEKMICKKIELSGHQDTLFLAPLPAAEREQGGFRGPGEFAPRKPTLQLYEKCIVSGTVDFVFGGAAALFRKCKFVVRNPVQSVPAALASETAQSVQETQAAHSAHGASVQDATPGVQAQGVTPIQAYKTEKKYYVAAPCADSPAAENDSSTGFFFKDCTFSVERETPIEHKTPIERETMPFQDRIGPAEAARASSTASEPVTSVLEPQIFIARPWRPYGRCFLFNCRIESGFSKELWHIWNNDEDKKTSGFYICDKKFEKNAPKPKDWGQELSESEKLSMLSKIETMLTNI